MDRSGKNSAHSPEQLSKAIKNLPENWTIAVMVPNASCVYEAKKFGFPTENIQIWSTSSEGVTEMGNTMRAATDAYMVSRSRGIRSTKSLFSLDASKLTQTHIAQVLQELKPSQYDLLPVRQDAVIKPFCESWLKEYRIGSAYYELVKPELVQANKQICVQDKLNGKVYSGLHARQLLGLPDFEVKVSPADYGKFRIFIQSSSVNRKLPFGTNLIVLK
jgi:hypothetical protein